MVDIDKARRMFARQRRGRLVRLHLDGDPLERY